MHRTQLQRTAKYRATARGKYANHKAKAKARGVPFLLTFKQWCCIWFTSGHWSERGDRPHQYVMSRKNDRGGYACGNVYIETNGRNRWEGGRTQWLPDGPRRRKATLNGEPGPDVPF